ncbi:hypothetical protein VTK73DRAFT_7709 [Phialemonium thermophilum]|uniref:FAD-binding domain-containing protein n=1 Tax=Phialemonium thermophilum TaxID=223376 RepID=A0ABR3WDC7_9PEZI
MAPLEILIVGCSIAGPSLASFLLLAPQPASQKPRITVLERSSGFRTQGQNVDIRSVGAQMIRKLGIEKEVHASSTGEKGVQWVTSDNRPWASIEAGDDDKGHTPTSDIEIMRGRLSRILYEKSKALSDRVQQQGGAGIEYIFGDHLDELDQDGAKVHVHFAKSGSRRAFDLVVGADGVQSLTRRMAWGVEGERERVRPLGVYGAFFSIPRRPETDTEWRRCYHTAGRRVLMLRPDMPSNRTTAFLYTINDKDPRLAQVGIDGRSSMGEQKALIKEYFEDAGWESQRIVREMMATDDFYYVSMEQVKMDRWSKGRVVLLGDAGYCATPMSGLGTTLALFGAYNLAGSLARYGDDVAAALDEYETRMRPFVTKAQDVKLGLFRFMNPESAWGVWLVDRFIRFMTWTRIINLLFLFKKPPKETEVVEDYGLETVKE